MIPHPPTHGSDSADSIDAAVTAAVGTPGNAPTASGAAANAPATHTSIRPHSAADDDSADASLAADVLRTLRPLGGVAVARVGRLRGLFHPPSCGDVPFGLVHRGAVFFKTGPETVTKYLARAARPFPRLGVRQPLRDYWRVPPDVLEDPELLLTWAAWAIDAARRFGKRRPAKLRRRRAGRRS